MAINNNSIKVSVIMPVLNGMPYFEKALDSVCKQKLTDIEIIVVDAGSTDGTLDYLSECITSDNRVKLIKTEKKSMGSQYNTGIFSASGKYVAFCESDDYMDKCMLYDLYIKAEQNHFPDCVKSNFYLFIDKGEEEFAITYDVMSGKKKELYNKEISLKDCSGLIFRDINMWNGIFLRTFILENNIRLNETSGAAFQDAGFIQQVNVSAKRQIYVPKAYYHYRRDNEGSSVYRKERSKFAMQECEFAIEWFNSNKDARCRYGLLVISRLLGTFVQLYAEDCFKYTTISYDNKLTSFQEKIQSFVREYSMAERSILETDLRVWLFLHNLDRFKILSSIHGEKEAWQMESFKNVISSCQVIVIVTAGDVGQGIYAMLVRNNWNGKAVFCDNDKNKQGTEIMGVNVLSVEQATERFPNAVYAVNPMMYQDLLAQLVANNIDFDKIVCPPFVCPHTSMEINLDNY